MAGSHHCQPSRSPYRTERGRAACRETEREGNGSEYSQIKILQIIKKVKEMAGPKKLLLILIIACIDFSNPAFSQVVQLVRRSTTSLLHYQIPLLKLLQMSQ